MLGAVPRSQGDPSTAQDSGTHATMAVQFVFGGPTPLAVMEQFTAVIGRPALVPYWTLGWHQCKYGPWGGWCTCCGWLGWHGLREASGAGLHSMPYQILTPNPLV